MQTDTSKENTHLIKEPSKHENDTIPTDIAHPKDNGSCCTNIASCLSACFWGYVRAVKEGNGPGPNDWPNNLPM